MKTLLEMRNITKSFPGVKALDGVTFDLGGNEIHALVGENGAGKSTLIKILAGVYPHPEYGGQIVLEGSERRFPNIRAAEQAGIAVIYQELSLVKDLSVAENIFLGREPRRFGVINWSELYSRAQKLLNELHLPIDPRAPVRNLGIGQQQLVEIGKALSQEARILVLDEPTAALTDAEVETLFGILQGLRERGVAMIYISHKLDEVFRLSNRITVLRDGRSIGTEATSELDEASVIAKMVGREVGQIFPEAKHGRGDVIFEARNITVEDPSVPGMFVGGQRIQVNHPYDAIKNGIGFVTEDRKRYGLILEQTILKNMTLAALRHLSGRFVTNEDAEAAAGERAARELHVKAPSVFTIAGTLSGGNQQKVVLAKWLLTKPRVLFLDEPTRGIDVGAKQEIYSEINRLAATGIAIVLVSSELPEVLGLSDRVIVLHEGSVTGEFNRSDATPEAVMSCATGRRQIAA